ncbi:MAG: hypothetical protein KJ621_06640 [Proteobacteria bacterium]|nr:hypothetical protein [Pseudomonadota bacterium]MBU1741674.1 hypothetical protein [Pseudomonadota bacterium]
MNLTNLLTIIALVLTFIALLIVAYQTYLTRKSLILAKNSIDDDRKIRQMELLPNAHFIFEVQWRLEEWIRDIDGSTKALQEAITTKNIELLKQISKNSREDPKGLVDRFLYEKGPRWLSATWLAAAQYYYSFKGSLRLLWNDSKNEPNWYFAQDLIVRGRNHSRHISNLLGYIDQTVPESYAESPASISDSKFLSD